MKNYILGTLYDTFFTTRSKKVKLMFKYSIMNE